jgi:hypothetical protein
MTLPGSELETEHCPFCLLMPNRENTCWAIISPWIRELGVTKRRVCRYSICSDCNLGWFSLRYSEAGLEKLYKNYRGERYTTVRHKWETWYDKEYNSGHVQPEWLKLRAEAITSFMLDKLDISMSDVVDIGGDTGSIAELLGARSFNVVEISDRPAYSTTSPLTHSSLAVLAHVLEHVSMPKAFLTSLLEIYDSLYVEVPSGIPLITTQRRSKARLVFGLIASMFPGTWRRYANPSAGRKNPAQLLRVSEHLTFFQESFFERLPAEDFVGANFVSCRTLDIVSPDRKTPVRVIQALWKRIP